MGKRPRILAQLGRAARGRFAAAGADWEQHVLGALVEDLTAGPVEQGKFLALMERLIPRLASSGMDVSAVDEVLSALREEIVPLVQGDPSRHCHAEDLFHAVRLATSGALQRGAGRAHISLSRWARAIAVVCNALAAAESYAELSAGLSRHLPELRLRSCFVVACDLQSKGETASVVACHGGPSNAEGALGKSFRSPELLPPQLAQTSGKGRSFAILPLLDTRNVLGHVLFEYTAEHAFACGVLAEAISVAVRSIRSGSARA